MKRKNKTKGHGNFWASKYYYFSIFLSTIFEDGLGSQVKVLVIFLELLVQSYLG